MSSPKQRHMTIEAEWDELPLGVPEVSSIIMGQSPESSTYNQTGNGLPFFQGKADFGSKHPKARVWCTAPARTAEPGDVLMSVRAPVGDVNIASEKCCIGRGVAAIRSGPRTDNEFLFYSLMVHKDKLDALGSGAIFKSINKDVLVSYRIKIPPLNEQRAIASVLSKIQAAAETQDKIVAKLKELKAATMMKLFRAGLYGEALKQTEFGSVPQSWKVVPCGALCREITVGIVVTPAKYYVPAGIPCFRSFNVKEDRLFEKKLVFISTQSNDIHSKSKLYAGDVVIVRTGYPGTACVIPDKYDGANCIDLIVARPKHDLVISDYLARYINSAEGKRQILMAQGGLAQQHFNVGAMKRLHVALPTKKDEQARISQIGQMLDSNVATAEDKATSIHGLFTSMIHMLMSGELRISAHQMAQIL